jgi:hypothetical protein
MSSAAALELALQPLREMLAADGYALNARDADDGRSIVLDVTATASACAECLAPAAVIASVARSCLSDSSMVTERTIEVRVPSEHVD